MSVRRKLSINTSRRQSYYIKDEDDDQGEWSSREDDGLPSSPSPQVKYRQTTSLFDDRIDDTGTVAIHTRRCNDNCDPFPTRSLVTERTCYKQIPATNVSHWSLGLDVKPT